MNFIIKKEDLGAFAVCVSQMMNEFGFCGFTYEDDFKNAVNSGTTEFFVSEDDEISVAFGNLKKQITNIESAKNIYFFISTKTDAAKAGVYEKYFREIAETSNAENVFLNIYDQEKDDKTKLYLFINK